MPTFRWACLACGVANLPESNACDFCLCSATPRMRDIEQAMQRIRAKEMIGATSLSDAVSQSIYRDALTIETPPTEPTNLTENERPKERCSSERESTISKILRTISEIFHAVWWMLPIAAMGIIFLAFYLGLIPLQGKDVAERGQFGDSFGVLNSLFTGLGFGGLVVTLILQQRQIRQQEAEIKIQQRSEHVRHYEETLHRLLSMYAATLEEVSTSKGDLRGRSLLRGSTHRVFEAVKKEKANIIPLEIQERYAKGKLTQEDKLFLDYLYFRNFKILSVEIDRQGRLVQTLIVLLNHLIYRVPENFDNKTYREMVCAQITYVEASYFFLVALTFRLETELRDLLLKSGLLEKAAHVKRLKIHDYMYKEFWGQNVRDFKKPQSLPIDGKRIDSAVRYYRKLMGDQAVRDPEIYVSPRTLASSASTSEQLKVR